ncbi:FAD-dependent oxidoreductase [Staphylococcus saprophyticus]|uniref:FAD-dependent oxidoreductase n=2 Tax=Staphylococcus TaxID=1279 RepID=UPI000E68BEC0|nr:FAD-dependent oxidoreductase [Staphylococcus saprophyticus]RIO27845.1 FAD-dependent oxidoreductase [Staphylococcus saprophyticus]RIO27855.1 FAD-dependent oxidoreductase [Staphylococcus saprophyticus]
MKIVVIGGSHGGIATIDALIDKYQELDVLWFDKGDFAINNALDNEQSKTKIEELTSKGVTIFQGTEVIDLNSETKSITIKNLKDNTLFYESYDKLILSPGSHPKTLNLPGGDLKNVITMANRQDLLEVRQASEDDNINNIVIVGAGYNGIGAVNMFINKNVTLIDHNNHSLSSYLDQELAEKIENKMKEASVTLEMKTSLIEIIGNNENKVIAVKTKDKILDADLVIITIGIEPNTKWLENKLLLNKEGYIEVNDYMETNIKDIFAIGDATLTKFNPLNKKVKIGLGTKARRQAYCAVMNLENEKLPFFGVQGSSGLNGFGYKFASTGLNEKQAQRENLNYNSVYIKERKLDNNFVVKNTLSKNNPLIYFKILYNIDTYQILGAQIMSTNDETNNINAMSIAIQNKYTITQLAFADFFFQPEFSKPLNFMNRAGIAAMKKEKLL